MTQIVSPELVAFYQKRHPDTDIAFVKTGDYFGVYIDPVRLYTDFPGLMDTKYGPRPEIYVHAGKPVAEPMDLATTGTQSRHWLRNFRMPETVGSIEAKIASPSADSSMSTDLFRRGRLPTRLCDIDPAGIKRIS